MPVFLRPPVGSPGRHLVEVGACLSDVRLGWMVERVGGAAPRVGQEVHKPGPYIEGQLG